jgi:hypothetical protein
LYSAFSRIFYTFKKSHKQAKNHLSLSFDILNYIYAIKQIAVPLRLNKNEKSISNAIKIPQATTHAEQRISSVVYGKRSRCRD